MSMGEWVAGVTWCRLPPLHAGDGAERYAVREAGLIDDVPFTAQDPLGV